MFFFLNKWFIICEVVFFFGIFVFSFLGVEFGFLYYCYIEVDKEVNLKLNQGNFDLFMILFYDSLEEIYWWFVNILIVLRRIFYSSFDVVVYIDVF